MRRKAPSLLLVFVVACGGGSLTSTDGDGDGGPILTVATLKSRWCEPGFVLEQAVAGSEYKITLNLLGGNANGAHDLSLVQNPPEDSCDGDGRLWEFEITFVLGSLENEIRSSLRLQDFARKEDQFFVFQPGPAWGSVVRGEHLENLELTLEFDDTSGQERSFVRRVGDDVGNREGQIRPGVLADPDTPIFVWLSRLGIDFTT